MSTLQSVQHIMLYRIRCFTFCVKPVSSHSNIGCIHVSIIFDTLFHVNAMLLPEAWHILGVSMRYLGVIVIDTCNLAINLT